MTNIDKEKFPAIAIRNIYRLRWQTELIFKHWKSTYKIDKTHKMKFYRWMTLFYARMLMMLIHWEIYHIAKKEKMRSQNEVISLAKALTSLKLNAKAITELIRKGIKTVKKVITVLLRLIATNHDLEKKKGRTSQEEIIDIIYCN